MNCLYKPVPFSFIRFYRFIGNRRGETRILGCEGGFAAFTPQNAELTTATPREPFYIRGWRPAKFQQFIDKSPPL